MSLVMDSNTLPPPLPTKDRKVGLVIFGVLTVLMGCFCALLVPLLILGMTMAEHSANPPPPSNVSLVPVGLLYGSLAVVLIWLGVGSMMARRWARALLAIWSWSWLIAGVMGMATMIIMAPQIFETIRSAQRPGQPDVSLLMLIPIIMMGFMFIVLPLIWALFYGGRNVKATCEARDPIVRWTDRCPLPVLAISLWLGVGGLMMLFMPMFHSVAPFFGVLISGAAGSALYLFMAVLWIYCAWTCYRLDRRGWWIIVAAMILFSVSSFVTYSRHDLNEVYSLMGYPQAQIAEIQKTGLIGNRTLRWTALVFTIPFLGYLLWVRKFFASAPRMAGEG